MSIGQLLAISPLDGRYHKTTYKLNKYFSEYAYIAYRVRVEIKYLLFLNSLNLPRWSQLSEESIKYLRNISKSFVLEEAEKVKKIEESTKHDVKAIEYYIKNLIKESQKEDLLSNIEYVHFGLTSQDINSTALSLLLKDFSSEFLNTLNNFIDHLDKLANNSDIICLAWTHGQPASPTSLKKELNVFRQRLINQREILLDHKFSAKFGGAVGNLNAHYAAYPDIDWDYSFSIFLKNLGLIRNKPTTQVDHNDGLVELLHIYSRINSILIDLSQDMWLYISKGYFKQNIIKSEVGSSTMPHKVNPINFENAEGNLVISNGLIDVFSRRLAISKLQRDLTDSTIMRNIGVALAHTCVALNSLETGFSKIEINSKLIEEELKNNSVVISEGIQTIMKSYAYHDAYEKMKELTRGQEVTMQLLHNFINELEIPEEVKQKLLELDVNNYIGELFLRRGK